MRRLPLRSPPRMRGKGIADDEARAAVGITPACAGKRMYFCCKLSSRRDHPRVCGEKAILVLHIDSAPGSPPRMRGKVYDMFDRKKHVGITPAYAGKSRIPSSAPTRFWDHPRVCGEKYIQCTNGKHARRITPAYAGKSSAFSLSHTWT